MYYAFLHIYIIVLFSKRAACAVHCVSAKFQNSFSLTRSHLNLLLCFPLHPLRATDCLNSDFDLCARLSRLRQALMKAIRTVCLPQYAGAPYKAPAEWILSTPTQQFPPSCHLSSLFSPSPEWILLILSTLAGGGGTLLAGLPPGPLHLPYLRQCPAPLLHVPARIHCTITPQMFTDMPFRFCGKGYG